MTEQPKKGLRQKAAEILYKPPRIQEGFNRLRKEAGFIPLFNIEDVEARRQEIRAILNECKTALFSREKQMEVVSKTYALFFSAGNPWYRGLDNRELADKVSNFLDNNVDIANMHGGPDSFIFDLWEESMQLLSLSWQALDVTKTPTYIVESQLQGNRERVDLTGSGNTSRSEEV